MKSSHFRIGIAVVLLVLVALSVSAGPLSYGAKVGLVFAKQSWTYSNDLSLDAKMRSGLGGGVFVEYKLAPVVSVRAEAMVVQKGFKLNVFHTIDYAPTGDTLDVHFRTNYLSFNLLAKATLPTGTYAEFGPRVDFRLSTSNDLNDAALKDITDSSRTALLGLTMGVGQEFKVLPKLTLFVEGQYYLDLTKSFEASLMGPEFDGTLESIKNQALAFYIGVRF